MKKWSGFLLLVVLVFVLFPTPNATAQSYMGNFCWSLTVTEDERGPISPPQTFLSRFDVVYLGGVSYGLQGKAVLPNADLSIIAGAAFIIGSDVYMNLSETATHPADPSRETQLLQVRLTLPSLNGTFYGLGADFNTSTKSFYSFYSAGTLTFVPCP